MSSAVPLDAINMVNTASKLEDKLNANNVKLTSGEFLSNDWRVLAPLVAIYGLGMLNSRDLGRACRGARE